MPHIDVDAPVPAPFRPESTIPSPGGRTHVVARGDTLQSISRRFYGSPAAWTRLFAANRSLIGPDPGATYPGQVLSVPY